jgi:hypothetical protein
MCLSGKWVNHNSLYTTQQSEDPGSFFLRKWLDLKDNSAFVSGFWLGKAHQQFCLKNGPDCEVTLTGLLTQTQLQKTEACLSQLGVFESGLSPKVRTRCIFAAENVTPSSVLTVDGLIGWGEWEATSDVVFVELLTQTVGTPDLASFPFHLVHALAVECHSFLSILTEEEFVVKFSHLFAGLSEVCFEPSTTIKYLGVQTRLS